jgi:hypothetical protein
MNEADRPFQRYFSLLNLHNSADVSARDLRLYRAAVAKVLTALGGQRNLVALRELDADGTVLAVDLRRLHWNRASLWQEVLRHYPYGLVYRDSPDAELRVVADAVAKLGDSECELPCVRADWFVATASRPTQAATLLNLLALADKDDRLKALAALQDDRDGPIAVLSRRYQRDLRLDDMACELGLRDAKLIKARLREPRLAPVLSGASLKRETWTSSGARIRTLFQETAFALGLGTPYLP